MPIFFEIFFAACLIFLLIIQIDFWWRTRNEQNRKGH